MRAPDAPVFVVGVARSGTTLLSAMLSAHPRLDCGPESRFFARFRHLDARARARIMDPATWPRPAVDFMATLQNQGHPVTELFGLTLPEIGTYLAGRQPSTTAMLESLTVLHAQRRGKPRWVEKTPRHLLMTETLREGWPDAFIVRIVRDPRDVALSLAGMPFAKSSVVGNLVRIDADDRSSSERLERDERAITLRYEDLVTEPERELRRVCQFIGEDYHTAMLDSRDHAVEVAADHEWWKEAATGPLNTASVGKWRHEMSADARRFAGLHLSEYLRAHGYEGAEEPRRAVAVVPVGAGVGPDNELLLLELARRGMVVERPAPTEMSTLHEAHSDQRLLYLGTRGQLDPSRGQGIGRRMQAAAYTTAGLMLRWLQRRPIMWLRRNTLRPKRTKDPVERLVSPFFRAFAREVSIEEAADLVGRDR